VCHGSVRVRTGSTRPRLESSLQALDAVQDGVRGEAQVPVEVFVADGVVEGDGLRAFEGLVFQGASDADALLCVGDGDEAVRKKDWVSEGGIRGWMWFFLP